MSKTKPMQVSEEAWKILMLEKTRTGKQLKVILDEKLGVKSK